MAMLHPSLWRTCRVLSGETRLKLLRTILDTPGQSVSELAHSLAISLPRASQELRRLQSRGLVQTRPQGVHVRYDPAPDPLVATAAPLLQAAKETFVGFPPAEDHQLTRIATGFSHPRRLSILRLLQIGPMNTRTLEDLSGMTRTALNRHLLKLQTAGLVRREHRQFHVVDHPHPMAQRLLRILQDSPVPRR